MMKNECYRKLYLEINPRGDINLSLMEVRTHGSVMVSIIRQSISQGKQVINHLYRPPSPKGALSKFLRSTVEEVLKRQKEE